MPASSASMTTAEHDATASSSATPTCGRRFATSTCAVRGVPPASGGSRRWRSGAPTTASTAPVSPSAATTCGSLTPSWSPAAGGAGSSSEWRSRERPTRSSATTRRSPSTVRGAILGGERIVTGGRVVAVSQTAISLSRYVSIGW